MEKIQEHPEKDARSRQTRLRYGLLAALAALGAGLVASLVTITIMGFLRLFAGIPTPVELFGDRVLKLLSADTFVRMLVTFGHDSKLGPLSLALWGMLALGTVLGLLYALLVRLRLPVQSWQPEKREWLTAAALSLVMILLAVILFWDELRQNFLGLPIDQARFATILGLILQFCAYGFILCLAYRMLIPHHYTEESGSSVQSQRRRQLLQRAGVAVVGLGAGVAGLQLGNEYKQRYTSYDGTQAHPHNEITSPITPNDEHYVVTQNPIDPTPNLDVWRLEVTGLVGKTGTYTYEQLKQLPSTSRAITLECIANGPGSGLMSTAIWHGVTLKTLLAHHGEAQNTAKYVSFSSVDGYTVSLPLQEVLEADALLAWQMNGSDLPLRHGYPLRVLIPGRYGEENPKWLTRVDLVDHFIGGLYSDQGWYNGQLHTMSRIDHPRSARKFGGPIEVGGIAFAGYRGIQKVEVSTDAGTTWNTATLTSPLSPDTWVFWNWTWQPAQAGDYTLVVRATDGTGEQQTSHRQGTVPNGATGYHEVKVTLQ
ncbi:molybdopterin-dependent oxidoreductase [Tengunoibacter tsumagoiensis]|uniref:Molybdopterin-binding oxidoreductase n=1 Tax=Tengunoibacter tsumagoiensis TaxID=2014871 RepID=A0A402A812_9CHLR|nr:molybdopterin-dependent oxidoreductase [Tengunoibacter tsumagoiensis]GCE15219.1 hypothetical protein KTT_50780 [Tengunoibacter tsumagoiensis]